MCRWRARKLCELKRIFVLHKIKAFNPERNKKNAKKNLGILESVGREFNL